MSRKELVQALEPILEPLQKIEQLSAQRDDLLGKKYNDSKKMKSELRPMAVHKVFININTFSAIQNDKPKTNPEEMKAEVDTVKKKLMPFVIATVALAVGCMIPNLQVLFIFAAISAVITVLMFLRKLQPVQLAYMNSVSDNDKYNNLVKEFHDSFTAFENDKQKAINELDRYAAYYNDFYEKYNLMVEKRYNKKIDNIIQAINAQIAYIKDLNIVPFEDVYYVPIIVNLLISNDADNYADALAMAKEIAKQKEKEELQRLEEEKIQQMKDAMKNYVAY